MDEIYWDEIVQDSGERLFESDENGMYIIDEETDEYIVDEE